MQESLSPAMENYLEAIYVLTGGKSAARVGDIARLAGVHKSTATAALRSLAERSLVEYKAYRPVRLTASGRRVGSDMARRHEALRGFLEDVLGIRAKVAAEAACSMEHVMPPEVIERFSAFAEYVRNCPHAVSRFEAGRGYMCETGSAGCARCMGADFPGKQDLEKDGDRRNQANA
jgi:DtxR family transcriptional regulator, Mn-dependent transcriptional regulator